MITFDFTEINGYEAVYYFFHHKGKLHCTHFSSGEICTYATCEEHLHSVKCNYEYYHGI